MAGDLDATIDKCRREVDVEIEKIREDLRKAAWTEERAKIVAEDAAKIAVDRITNNFYMSVGRRTVAIIGALVVGLALWLHDLWLPKVK